MALKFSTAKDPDEVLDYTINWTSRMVSTDTIETVTVTGNNVTIDSDSLSGNVVTVWLSGGNVGTASVHCRITTEEGRTMDQTVTLKIATK
jgi:hypothetical protein